MIHPSVSRSISAKGLPLNLASAFLCLAPLHAAVSKGRVDKVSLLLKAGADVNVKGSNGRTPLRAAARTGRADMVSLLKEAGAKE